MNGLPPLPSLDRFDISAPTIHQIGRLVPGVSPFLLRVWKDQAQLEVPVQTPQGTVGIPLITVKFPDEWGHRAARKDPLTFATRLLAEVVVEVGNVAVATLAAEEKAQAEKQKAAEGTD